MAMPVPARAASAPLAALGHPRDALGHERRDAVRAQDGGLGRAALGRVEDDLLASAGREAL
eukprot:143728-Prymnesium_polylepis.1